MINIITALADYEINEKIKKEKEINILTKDIQYEEGIFEFLKINKKIDYLILGENLLRKNNLKDIIEKTKQKNKNIKIILILGKELEEIKNNKNFYKNNINKIYYKKEININEIICYIKNNINIKENFKNEKSLNQIFLKNNLNLNQKKFSNNKKIISVTGAGGVGKSIITLNLVNILKEKNNKILIVDFDILNNSLHTILGVNKYSQKIKDNLQKNKLNENKINIKDLIIKINKKVDLISGINLLFDSKYKISSEKINFIFEQLKKYYDIIIVDTSSECFFDYTKNILKNSNIILFLLESNLLEIKKSNNLLKIYTEDWKIEKQKINIIINKYNENSVDDKIIKNIFSEYKILGKIKLNKKYNILINKNYKENIFTKKIKKEYENISNEIIKINN